MSDYDTSASTRLLTDDREVRIGSSDELVDEGCVFCDGVQAVVSGGRSAGLEAAVQSVVEPTCPLAVTGWRRGLLAGLPGSKER